MRILLVDNDELVGRDVQSGLQEAGFTVDWTRDEVHAQISLATTPYLLVVLDIDLSGRSGIKLLRWLRQGGNQVPVLILTARHTAAEKVQGLEAGADDYVGKPFDAAELIARCRALIRRACGRASNRIVSGEFTVDCAARTVMRGGHAVGLTAREWAVFYHLLTHAGAPQLRSKIADSLYGWHEEIVSNAVEVHVSNLRKKLGVDAIRTVRGYGYMMHGSGNHIK